MHQINRNQNIGTKLTLIPEFMDQNIATKLTVAPKCVIPKYREENVDFFRIIR